MVVEHLVFKLKRVCARLTSHPRVTSKTSIMPPVKGFKYKADPTALAQLHKWLGNFSLPDIDGSGYGILTDSDYIFIYLATMYCTANVLLDDQ